MSITSYKIQSALILLQHEENSQNRKEIYQFLQAMENFTGNLSTERLNYLIGLNPLNETPDNQSLLIRVKRMAITILNSSDFELHQIANTINDQRIPLFDMPAVDLINQPSILNRLAPLLTYMEVNRAPAELEDFFHYATNIRQLITRDIPVSNYFNHPCNNFQNVEYLQISTPNDPCEIPLESFPQLKILKIYQGNFNKPTINHPTLEEIELYQCPEFNQKFENLPKLRKLEMRKCNKFNSSLKNLPNLETFFTGDLEDFTISNKPFETLDLLYRFELLGDFFEQWQDMDVDARTQVQNTLRNHYRNHFIDEQNIDEDFLSFFDLTLPDVIEPIPKRKMV